MKNQMKKNTKKVNKQQIAETIKKTYVLNKPIAKSIVDDVVTNIHRQDMVIITRKELNELYQLREEKENRIKLAQ